MPVLNDQQWWNGSTSTVSSSVILNCFHFSGTSLTSSLYLNPSEAL